VSADKNGLPSDANDAESVRKLWKEQAEQIRATARQVASELQKNAGQRRARQPRKR